MKISALNSNYYKIPTYPAITSTTFGHHPDFDMIKKMGSVCYSGYFRRGTSFIDPAEGFLNIVNLFRKAFNVINEPKKMLIVGIANSEEPFSYLATIKSFTNNKPIEDVLDLHIIDLQSKPDENKLFDDSYTMSYVPIYAKNGFVYNPHPKIPLYDYRVCDELFNFLKKTYNDPAKSKWETRVQEAITAYPDNYFDIISINNVLYYIKDKPIETFSHVYRAVKPEGYIISEQDKYANESGFINNLSRLCSGVYKKLK